MWYEILRRLIFQGIEGFGNTADSPSIWILPTRTKRKASSKWKINSFFILLCSMRKDNTRILSSFLNLQFNITWLFFTCIKRRWENEFDIKKTETRSTDANIQTKKLKHGHWFITCLVSTSPAQILPEDLGLKFIHVTWKFFKKILQ